MNKELSICRILEFLEKSNIKYTFIGNEKDTIAGFSSLFNYKENSMTFISSFYNFRDYIDKFKDNKQIKLIISNPSETVYPYFKNVIQVKKPQRTFFLILEEFFDESMDASDNYINGKENFKKSFVSKDAIIGNNVKIGIGCVIEGGVQIGDNTVIHHNVVIRKNTKIGKNCTIFSGTVIGERGFNPNTLEDGSRKMLRHYGGVIIEDNVHIGDNCSISKGTIDDTVIKRGVKLNALIRVAHNSVIGEHTVITMPAFICGSVVIGKNCHIAASVIRNQCKIGDNAILGLGSVVVVVVPDNTTVVGNPAKPIVK